MIGKQEHEVGEVLDVFVLDFSDEIAREEPWSVNENP